MHSGLFAVTPHSAAMLLEMLITHKLVSTSIAQVRDLDEDQLRAGHVTSRYYGEMITPQEGRYLQHVKCGGKESEELVHEEIAAYLIESMEPDVTYIIGSGSTTKALKDVLGIDGTLLGVDVVCNHIQVAKDVDEHELFSLIHNRSPVLIVTLIGGQGHVFGRGNQQLSERVLDQISDIQIIATKEKIGSLEGRPMVCDTGSETLDRKLTGLKTIITGYEDTVVYPLKNPDIDPLRN
jgi:predicted polyphosphate/ATP-dependent NAD kinase